MRVGRLTLSDRAAAGIYEDLSGPAIETALRGVFATEIEFVPRLLADNEAEIATALRELADIERCPLILTTGGTGPTRRDVTPEATRAVLEKELPGFGEIMRQKSFEIAPTAILSRATAGIRSGSLIINLPGSPKAVRECLAILGPAIRECLRHLADDTAP